MKILAGLILVFALSGCATVQSWVPSFWDSNQSAKIVDIAVAAEGIDCDQDQRPQALHLQRELAWFVKYSETKGARQQDVLLLIRPIEETVADWAQRTASSPAYCRIKKQLLIQQTTRAAEAVQGRF